MSVGKNRAVFFDRDGVLNRSLVINGKALAPLTLDDFIIEPTAQESVKILKSKGFLCFVVTNQPEISRGNVSQATIEKMHSKLRASVALDGIYICPHDPIENCPCHKPKPGLLKIAAKEHSIDLKSSYLIGDRWRDIGAGNAAGCYSILLKRDYSGECTPNLRVTSLLEATGAIIAHAQI